MQTGDSDVQQGSKHPGEGVIPVDTLEKSIQACSFIHSIFTTCVVYCYPHLRHDEADTQRDYSHV